MSLINIGMSGLNASQFALNTTGNNISNSGTAGYNRQVVDYTQADSQFAGVGYVGQGVLVSDVSRVYDQFLSNQVNQAQTQYSQLNTYYQQISQINNALGSSTTGLSASMSTFFTNLQTIVTAPNNSATRATVISSAQTLTSMFQSLSGTLSSLRTSVNGNITRRPRRSTRTRSRSPALTTRFCRRRATAPIPCRTTCSTSAIRPSQA